MSIPKINRIADTEAAILVPGERNCPGLQDRTSFPEWDYHGIAGSGRGIFGWSVQGYQPLCHPCKKGNYRAQGHPASEAYLGRMYITPSSF